VIWSYFAGLKAMSVTKPYFRNWFDGILLAFGTKLMTKYLKNQRCYTIGDKIIM